MTTEGDKVTYDGSEGDSAPDSSGDNDAGDVELGTKKPSAIDFVVERPWILISGIIILSTLLQSLSPAYTYWSKYLTEHVGMDKAIYNLEITPWRSYFFVCALFPVTFAGEYFGYIPILAFGLLCRLFTQFGFYYGPQIFAGDMDLIKLSLQLSLGIFGFSHSTKTIHSAFVYRMIPLHKFQVVTSYLRGAGLLAHVCGGFIGQAMYDYGGTSKWMMMFTTAQVNVILGVALFVVAIVIQRRNQDDTDRQPTARLAPKLNTSVFKEMFHSKDVIVYSIWWCVGLCICDLMWEFQPSVISDLATGSDYSGYGMAITRLLCFASAMLSGRSRALMQKFGFQILSLSAGIIGVAMLFSGITRNIWVSFVLFFLHMITFEFSLTSSIAFVAMKVPSSLRGFVILTNTGIAMLLQSILQFTCNRLDMNLFSKYYLYGCIMLALSGFMFIVTMHTQINSFLVLIGVIKQVGTVDDVVAIDTDVLQTEISQEKGIVVESN